MKISKLTKLILIMSLSTPAISMDGIWNGVFDINGNGSYDFTGLISKNKATAYTQKAKVIYDGKIEKTENIITWRLQMYLKDGTKFGTATIKCSIINENIMSGKWVTEPAKDYGNIYLVKFKKNEIESAGNIINRDWSSKKNKIKHNISIKENKIFGKDANNCNYYGDIKKLNEKIYFVGIEIASCGPSDGFYTGMAHIRKINGENNLIINATNKNFSFFLNLH